MNIEESKKVYMEYIVKHIGNVQKIWYRFKQTSWITMTLEELDKLDYALLDHLIRVHDQSKFSEVEFEGYRQFYYTADIETKDFDKFNYAWNHHQKSNPHHWNYWVLIGQENEALEMPCEYIIEMICDWAGMSLYFNDTPSQFYNKNYDKMMVHKNTKLNILKFLPLFDQVIMEMFTANISQEILVVLK